MKPNGIECLCAYCGERFIRLPSRLKRHNRPVDAPTFCSHPCYLAHKKENRAGCITPTGYHQVSIECQTVLVHRLIMEEHLGRKLLPEEVVHHKNENRSDNRIENLVLTKNNGEHMRLHGEERWSLAEAAFLLSNGVQFKQIADVLGVKKAAVHARLTRNKLVGPHKKRGTKSLEEITRLRSEFASLPPIKG